MRVNRALVIGAGGTGGHLIPPLARLLNYHPNAKVSRINVVDGDAFEDHNIERQHIGPGQVENNKAEWIAQLCAFMGLGLDAEPIYLDRPYLRRWIRSDATPLLVVAAVDNDATRKICIDVLSEEHGRDFLFVTPGNAGADDPAAAIKGNVLWFGSIGGEAIGLSPALVYPNIESPNDDAPRHGTCAAQAPSSPQLITANALAAALTLTVIQNALDGLLDPGYSAAFFNGRSLQLSAS